MDKRGQINFGNEAFSQESPTEKNTSMPARIVQGILMAIFLFIFAPVLVAISDGMQPYVCGTPIVCLFFKFIVPAIILGGIFSIFKYIWREN
jgi:membrane protease YdiL (CAAX protease family)